MLYFLATYYTGCEFLKSIYLRDFISFSLSFLLVFFFGRPFIHYLQKKKFGETIRQEGPASHMSKKGTPTMGSADYFFSSAKYFLGGGYEEFFYSTSGLFDFDICRNRFY